MTGVPKAEAAGAAFTENDRDGSAPVAPVREELFISYAIEDAAFVRWLAAKLAMCGYHVWWDRTHLHGGAAFPSEIDDAIKRRAFLLLAVLSHASAKKANPERERAVAINVGRERGVDFLVPLNLELKPSELPFQVVNLTFVPFMESWAEGLSALLATLRNAGAPRFPGEATSMVRAHLAQPDFIVDEPERVWMNLFPLMNEPAGISRYEWTQEVPDAALGAWIRQRESASACWAFEPPPDVTGMRRPARDQHATSSVSTSKSTPMAYRCSSLLRQYVERRCAERGLVAVPDREHFYFPASHPNASRLPYRRPDGRETWLSPIGTRKIWQGDRYEQVRYHLAVRPKVELSRFGAPMLQVVPTVYFSAEDGTVVDSLRNVRRAKAVRRGWYNDKWLARVAAIGHFLADGGDSWRVCPGLATTISSAPLGFFAPFRLDETARAAALRTAAEATEECEDPDLPLDDEAETEDGDD